MLDMIFILLFVMALLMMLMSIGLEDSHTYWSIICMFLAVGLWLILSVGGMEIDMAYQYYNVTSGTMDTGYQTYFDIPELAYLYLGLSTVCMIYLVTLIFEPISKWFGSITRWR